jgi:hypothetical protein
MFLNLFLNFVLLSTRLTRKFTNPDGQGYAQAIGKALFVHA